MRATDVVFGGKRAFCERFLRWSRRFLWLRHRHPSFVMSCSFTIRGRLLADGPCRLLADGPWSYTDDSWFPKRVVYGWLVVVHGWPVVVHGWPVVVNGRPVVGPWFPKRVVYSTDGLWSSTDGPWSSTDGPLVPSRGAEADPWSCKLSRFHRCKL